MKRGYTNWDEVVLDLNYMINSKKNPLKNKFKVNKIDIYEYFNAYLDMEKGSIKIAEKFIYRFLYENIFIYSREFNICKPKEMIKKKEEFLDYIMEQIFIKYRLKYDSNVNSVLNKDCKEIIDQYLKKLYEGQFEFNDHFFRTKYSNFKNSKKNIMINYLRIFPEIVHYLNMYKFKYENNDIDSEAEQVYINEKFHNIIHQITVKKEEEYSFKEFFEFYIGFNIFINLDKDNSYNPIKIIMFEKIFKNLRICIIIEHMLKSSQNKQLGKQLLLLISALDIQSLRVSLEMIEKIIDKNYSKKKYYIRILYYIEVFNIIDKLVDIMINREKINDEQYIRICNQYIKKLSDNESLGAEVNKPMESIQNDFFNEKREKLFQMLKKNIIFYKKNKMNFENKEKNLKKIYFQDFKKIAEINFYKELKKIKH